MVLERRVLDPDATLVCIHGGLDRGGSFARLARRLNDVDVVAYDRRGYQGSRDVQPVGLSHHVADLVALIGAQRATPVILFGHSYGGVVALAAASAHPELVDDVIIYETPLPWIYRRPGSHLTLGENPEFEAELFFRRVVSDATWERLSESEKESRRADGIALLDDLNVVRGPMPFDLSTLRPRLSYGYGDADGSDYYHDLTEHLAAIVPTLRSQRLDRAGHGVHLASPDLLANYISSEWRASCA